MDLEKRIKELKEANINIQQGIDKYRKAVSTLEVNFIGNKGAIQELEKLLEQDKVEAEKKEPTKDKK